MTFYQKSGIIFFYIRHSPKTFNISSSWASNKNEFEANFVVILRSDTSRYFFLSKVSEETLKMKPLETSQRVLTWLCMCPASANTDKLTKLAYISLTIFTFIGMTGIITSSVAFFVTFFSTRLEEALVSMFQVSGTGGSWYMFIAVFPSRHKIKTIFDRLTEICANSTIFTTTTSSFEIIQTNFF